MNFKVACIFGTRPETIKMAPIIHKLNEQTNVNTQVICSGQHRELLFPLLDWFNLKVDVNLDLMQTNQNLNELSSKLIYEFGNLFKKENYDCVIAQGDTTTVLMSAIAAFHSKVPFAHVEAGLRTHNRNFPFPEEMNRVLTGKLASLHFAPTETAAKNLYQEGVSSDKVLITGNTVIDALYYTKKKLDRHGKTAGNKKIILVTVHRRENFGQPLQEICGALLKIANKHSDVAIILPVHPNPNVKNIIYNKLGSSKNITLVNPLPYEEMISYLMKCYLIVTDSGGVQEEAPALKKPVLVLRNETERPELVKLGGSKLVGNDVEVIFNTIEKLLTDENEYRKMIVGYSPYGDGNASELISKKIIDCLHAKKLEASTN